MIFIKQKFSSKNYYVNDTHPTLKSIDGVLYSKDLSTIVGFPIGRRVEYSILDGTKVIKEGAFKTSNVTGVTLPESIEVIEKSTFELAKRLRKINIPSKIKEIKESTFDTCSVLKEISFSEGLEKIGYRAFWQCSNINSLTLPNSLRIIDESGFEGLSGVENLVLPEGLEEIGDFAFAYNKYIETYNFSKLILGGRGYLKQENETLDNIFVAQSEQNILYLIENDMSTK